MNSSASPPASACAARRWASQSFPGDLGIISLAWLLFCVCFALGCGTSPVQRELEQGSAELARGEYSLAQEHYSQALEFDPRSAAAYLGRGKSLAGQDSLAQAAQDYARAWEIQPDLTEARDRLLEVLVEMGDGRRALDHFQNLSSSALTTSLRIVRGRAQIQVENFSAALADFDQILQLVPKHVSALYYRGLAHAKLGELSAAEQDFTAAISLDADHASAYWQRGLVRERRGAKDLAATDRQKATELDPRLGFAQSQMGQKMLENLSGQKSDDQQLELLSKESR